MAVELPSRLFLATLALIGCSQATSASAPPPPRSLVEAAQAFDAAQLHGDARALKRLLADDYLLLNGDGTEEDRMAFIRDYSTPGFHLDPFEVRHAVVRTWSGGAIMGGIARLSGTSGGRRFDRCIRFTDVWSLRRGRWLVALTHVSRPPAGACDLK